jgi:hypothetical protein
MHRDRQRPPEVGIMSGHSVHSSTVRLFADMALHIRRERYVSPHRAGIVNLVGDIECGQNFFTIISAAPVGLYFDRFRVKHRGSNRSR